MALVEIGHPMLAGGTDLLASISHLQGVWPAAHDRVHRQPAARGRAARRCRQAGRRVRPRPELPRLDNGRPGPAHEHLPPLGGPHRRRAATRACPGGPDPSGADRRGAAALVPGRARRPGADAAGGRPRAGLLGLPARCTCAADILGAAAGPRDGCTPGGRRVGAAVNSRRWTWPSPPTASTSC